MDFESRLPGGVEKWSVRTPLRPYAPRGIHSARTLSNQGIQKASKTLTHAHCHQGPFWVTVALILRLWPQAVKQIPVHRFEFSRSSNTTGKQQSNEFLDIRQALQEKVT